MNTRQQNILQVVNQRKSVSVSELAQISGVSVVTIRQDLNALERGSYLKRVHGYAVAMESDDVDARMQTNFQLKKSLAEYAASLVAEGESVFIEGGSANALLARYLAQSRRVTIITVSCYIAHLLKDTDCDVIIPGGFYQKSSESVVGPLTRSAIQLVHFRKAFIGIDGYHEDTGFTGRDMMRSDVVSAVLDKGVETIALTDSSKFGLIQPYALTSQHQISRVVTDDALSAAYRASLAGLGIRCDIVTEEGRSPAG
ncbi:DeoR/GlpR transcriptional regulator [Affinibrenneria salicis]|uniref:DeoR/GlpR transcriptional regulator n=1 Tax=Affinibrenneria salicis TaxID=2590031 RepID=A0A5J5G1R9_9GAMM|nr:DNA-binding transcriptional regulator YciT [Affinibrenneria salicis]KAA9000674.1 DeoR/GlpR transcriptional regulator [Affinibrenneria salicis]